MLGHASSSDLAWSSSHGRLWMEQKWMTRSSLWCPTSNGPCWCGPWRYSMMGLWSLRAEGALNGIHHSHWPAWVGHSFSHPDWNWHLCFGWHMGALCQNDAQEPFLGNDFCWFGLCCRQLAWNQWPTQALEARSCQGFGVATWWCWLRKAGSFQWRD